MLSEQLWTAYRDLVAIVTDVLPRIAIGVMTAIALVLVAKLIRRAAATACRRAHVDTLSESLGLTALAGRVGVRQPASQWVPTLIYVGLLMLFAQTAATVFGLTPVADMIRAFFGTSPISSPPLR